jgi:hypothetical protein
MAVLQYKDLSFDFRFTGFRHDWVQYQFYFLWQNEPLIGDTQLKRWSGYWNDRPAGAFLANEYNQDTFLPFLKQALASSDACYWEPTEPDILIALYPEQIFPFLKPNELILYESEELTEAREERKWLKAAKGALPDDLFTFIVFVDAYNFKDAESYYGQGLALHMVVERRQLEKFTADLEQEYQQFQKSLPGE